MPGLLRRRQPTQEPPATEATLAVQARGDPQAFAALYDRYFDPVYRYCYHRLGTREAAEDATSQVFLRVMTALPRYREGGAFRSWLFTIAHNVVVDRARAFAHEPLEAAAAHADPTPLPEDQAVVADEQRRLAAGVAALPPDQRRVIELRLAGLTGPEIARVLGRSHAAVKMLQLRAVDRLRDRIGGGAGEVHDAAG